MDNENQPETIPELALADELATLVKIDQETRREGPPADPEVDIASTKRMKEIISEIGWPTISKVGETGSFNAWLLVQHAIHDLAFQVECLKLMKGVPPEDVSASNIAYLEDRVRLAQGQKQLYGTQVEKGEHSWISAPIENKAEVAERRAALGMKPLEEYVKELNGLYTNEAFTPIK